MNATITLSLENLAIKASKRTVCQSKCLVQKGQSSPTPQASNRRREVEILLKKTRHLMTPRLNIMAQHVRRKCLIELHRRHLAGTWSIINASRHGSFVFTNDEKKHGLLVDEEFRPPPQKNIRLTRQICMLWTKPRWWPVAMTTEADCVRVANRENKRRMALQPELQVFWQCGNREIWARVSTGNSAATETW